MAYNFIKSKEKLAATAAIYHRSGMICFKYTCLHCGKTHMHPHGPYGTAIPVTKTVTASCGGEVYLWDIQPPKRKRSATDLHGLTQMESGLIQIQRVHVESLPISRRPWVCSTLASNAVIARFVWRPGRKRFVAEMDPGFVFESGHLSDLAYLLDHLTGSARRK